MRVAIFGLDYLARKNLPHIEALGSRGYGFDIFVNSADRQRSGGVGPPHALHLVHAGAVARMRQIGRYLREHRDVLNHVEVYPGGRFCGVYALMARAVGVPVLVAERGDLVDVDRYDALRRMSMRVAYRAAHTVWFREPYQEALLRAFGARRLCFIHNAIDAAYDPRSTVGADRAVDFLWVNRFTRERQSSWFVDAMRHPELGTARAVMVGVLPPEQADDATLANQAYARAHAGDNLTLHPFSDPTDFYRDSRFFVLAAEKVFCNNALLEAMAHGVVPIVSDVEAARLIVEHGVSGFVVPHDAVALQRTMRMAAALSSEQVARMSRGAMDRVRTHFAAERRHALLEAEYRSIGRARRETAAPQRASSGGRLGGET